MRVDDAVWIRLDGQLRIVLPLWADHLGHAANSIQSGTDARFFNEK